MSLNQFGLIGLGVMGNSLALNLLDNGIRLSVYNRQVPEKEVDLAKNFENENTGCSGFDDLALFTLSLERPRKVLIMVIAGKVVDDVISNLLPYLDEGDIVMDGGNSHFSDTKKRSDHLAGMGIHFLGIGISGGQEGARKGPSLMPGGNIESYNQVSFFLELISAKDKNNNPCCTYIGPEGSGHFVKMVHNGIEYAEMQILAELYYIMRYMLLYSPEEISKTLQQWKLEGEGGYLSDITQEILLKKEEGKLILDAILDVAEQKDTGGWSLKAALDVGSPLNTISDAVSARMISSQKEKRVRASKLYSNISGKSEPEAISLMQLKSAFVLSRLVNHIIGINMIHKTSLKYNWNLNLSELARIWTNGCIIKSDLMEKIHLMLKEENDLFFHESVIETISNSFEGFTYTVSKSLQKGFPSPVMSSALTFLLNLTTENCSANMIQAQRDYFGAHTYKRVDKSPFEYFHTQW